MDMHPVILGDFPDQRSQMNLVGEARGALDRERLHIMDHPEGITIRIAPHVMSVSSSYYLGLLGRYLDGVTSIDACIEKVHIHGTMNQMREFSNALHRLTLLQSTPRMP